MSIKFEVKMTDKIMYDFMVHHNYNSAGGVLGAVIGCASLIFGGRIMADGDTTMAIPMFFVALVWLILPPFTMRGKAKMQVKGTPMFQKPLEYELEEDGLWVRQEELETKNGWDEFVKVVDTRRSVILYLSKIRAIILPKEAMGASYEEVLKMLHAKISPNKIKIRHLR